MVMMDGWMEADSRAGSEEMDTLGREVDINSSSGFTSSNSYILYL